MQAKKSTDTWFPVVLLDDTDGKTAETGVAFGDVTCKYYQASSGATSLQTYSVTTDDWKEAGEGMYSLKIGAGEFSAEGIWEVSIAAAVARTYRFYVEVVDKTAADVVDDIETIDGIVDDILVDTGTTIPTVVDAIKTKTDNLPASPAAVGSLMGLANDAITSAKYDESTAFPLKSADSGNTQVARTGADSDTLETLSDQIDGVGGGGGATAADIADAVWDEAKADHTAGGSFGEEVQAHSLSSEVSTVDTVVDAIHAGTVDTDSVDTGFNLAAALKRLLAVLDGDIALDGTKLIHTIKDKDGNTETTHSLSDSGRSVT